MAASIKEASDPGTTTRMWKRRASFASHEDLGRGLANMSDVFEDRSSTPTGEQSDEKWSVNVQQLIQETERAFEAVGNAMSEMHLTSWLFHAAEPAAPAPIVPRHPVTPEPLPTSSGQDKRKKDGPSERKPLVRKASVSKSQRRKRGRKAGRDVFGSARSQATAIPWTLAESVSSVLGQRFKRVVADEMITPERMEELKRGREEAQAAEARLQRECRSSTESNRSTVTDLSVQSDESFYLESLLLNTGSAADEANVLSTAAVMEGDVISSDFQVPEYAATPSGGMQGTEGMTFDELAFPSPPRKRNGRQGARAPQTARLPTIPEGSPTASGSLRRRPGTRRRCRAKQVPKPEESVEEKEGRIYFKSTPLSSANRAFRHGPISFQKPVAGKRRGCAEDVDETVDWTAFQMAILGGAGDLASGMYEDDQNQMADDMAEWFETFGFETPGELIAANSRRPLDPPHDVYSSSMASVNSDMELPIPVQSERHSPRDTVRFFRGSNSAGTRYYMPAQEQQSGHGFVGRDVKRGPTRLLVVGEEVPEDMSEGLAERVPMGCNLEQDLDEFLRWERQYVCGGVF